MKLVINKPTKYSLPTDYTKLLPSQKREVREQYILEQKDLCMFCHGTLSLPAPQEVTEKLIDWRMFPPGFLNSPIHLQHCHDTNMTEGAVHAYCNAVLWQYYRR